MSNLAIHGGPKAVQTPPGDLFRWPIITEEDGTVKWMDIIEGTTLHQEKNRITGLIERVTR